MFRRVFSRLCFRRSFVTFLPPGTTNIRTRTNNSVLRVDGPDAEKFLQGLASNDLLYEGWTKRFSGPAAYTGFFNHRGRYLFDAIIVLCGSSESPTGYLLDIDCGAVGSAIAHFKRYQLKSDVNFVNVTEEYHVQSFVSPDRYLLSEVISCVESLKQDEAKAFFDPRVSSLGVRTISPTSTIFSPKVLDAFFRVADETFLDVHRMLNGVGRFSRELMPTKTIPLEANLDWLNGISFTKGCYLGQELIARTHFRGVIRKRFLPVLFHRSAPGARAAAHPLFSPACSFDPTCLVKFAGSEAAIIESLGTSEEVGSVLTATKGNLAMAKMRTEAIFSTSLSGLTGCRCENFFVHPVIPSWWIPRQ